MIQKEFPRQAPMVLTEETRWCLQRDSERRHKSMSRLVRAALDVQYGLIDGKFPEGDPRIQQMKDDPLPPPNK